MSYETEIKQLFREEDRDAMSFAFDLWLWEDVTENAEEILARLRAGSMPCDGAWPDSHVDLFAHWIDTGKAA